MTWVEGVFLATYFLVLLVLSIYGSHRYVMAYLYYKYKGNKPAPKARWEELPRVTIQLPIFNEMYVIERLIDAVAKIEYPRDLLEVQVLDDSTDETQGIARAAVGRARDAGLASVSLLRLQGGRAAGGPPGRARRAGCRLRRRLRAQK
jgi:cellulose synthase/poly-beta-1,6-N-acetylglucosamine synthase-like glycosyltransferase